MWQLTKLEATNICAFEHLEYQPIQNQATLVFGNNLDNDSQNSNGSGKSALIEALAIGILGEPLRKVNADEIINDRFDEATVSIILFDDMADMSMVVNRKLSRKNPQDIQITLGDENIKQSSVADYNRYVLEQIGLNKDDILHNFILTARKYQSFLSSSDKDKKEIINRFSNGIMVDESIEALRADIEPIQQSLQEAESEVARCNGRISALAEEIENYIENESARKVTTQSRIANIQASISDKRAEIREWKKQQGDTELLLESLDNIDADMQTLEKSDDDIVGAYKKINSCFVQAKLPTISDYQAKIENSQKQCERLAEEITGLNNEVQNLSEKSKALENGLLAIEKSNQKEFDNLDKRSQEIHNEIVKLRDLVTQLREQDIDLSKKRNTVNQAIATMEKQLAGVIECPKCHYEFTLAGDIDVCEARKKLTQHKAELEEIEVSIRDINEKCAQRIEEGKAKRDEQTKIDDTKQALALAYNEANRKVINTQSAFLSLSNDLSAVKSKLKSAQKEIADMRKEMFDEVFDVIDDAIKRNEQDINRADRSIQMAQASIETFEEQIKQLQAPSQNNGLEHMKESKAKYEKDLEKAEANKKEIAAKLDALKVQEATFAEFKTYLANTKINAISQITNDFLEAIGSDIRVNLSGYTILKSGKIRDKISVSLIRDGIDCGSFDKFSAGEKCRVELASVLALHKLSNVNCEEGKGLNLLVIDEILDCTDEIGLANVFKALNDTQVTALVVSHGNIAENYPNRLVVTKQNGVSTINGVTKQ